MKNNVRLVISVILMVIYNLSVIVFSWCFKLVTDSLIYGRFNEFKTDILFAIGVVAVQAVSSYLFIREKNIYVKEKMMSLKSAYITSLFNYDISDFLKKEKSEYQSFLFNDFNIYEQRIVIGKFDMSEKVILMIFSAIAIALINKDFIILVIALALICVAFPILFGRIAKKYNDELSADNREAVEKFNEMLDGFVTLRGFLCEDKGINECNKALENTENSKMKYKTIMALFQAILIIVTTMFTLIIFIWGGGAVIDGKMTVGELIALIQMLFNVANPIMGIMTALSNIRGAKPIVEKYKRYLSIHRNDGEEKFIFNKSIEIKNLDFAYEDDDNSGLKDLSCSFGKGKKYAIVGENGSGKSSLLKVIAGINDLNKYSGEIRIDGIERKKIKDTEFWKNVSYIPQEVFLFKNRLMKNIFIGDKQCGNLEFSELVKKLGLTELIEEDKENRAAELSGGEKQRVAFVREMLKESKVIIADEPDSALDVEAGHKVIDILLNCNKTCIVVTHRMGSILQGFDEILVMAGGKLVERGSYNSLMKSRGIFYKICNNEEDG